MNNGKSQFAMSLNAEGRLVTALDNVQKPLVLRGRVKVKWIRTRGHLRVRRASSITKRSEVWCNKTQIVAGLINDGGAPLYIRRCDDGYRTRLCPPLWPRRNSVPPVTKVVHRTWNKNKYTAVTEGKKQRNRFWFQRLIACAMLNVCIRYMCMYQVRGKACIRVKERSRKRPCAWNYGELMSSGDTLPDRSTFEFDWSSSNPQQNF